MTDHSTDTPPQSAPSWFRPAQEADLSALEALSDIVQHLHSDARPDIFRAGVDPAGRRAFFSKAIEEADWQIWIAGRGIQTQGYALSEIIHKDTGPIRHAHSEGHIHQICVAPQARRRELASGLMHHLLDDLRSHNPDRITVAYWAFNDASRRFFEQQGFAPVMITAELGASSPPGP